MARTLALWFVLLVACSEAGAGDDASSTAGSDADAGVGGPSSHCDSNADCGALNLDDIENSVFDSCAPWQCAKSHYCEKGPFDADHDGFSPARCAAEEARQDCDDDDEGRAPDLEETCDDKDNDCDLRVDEGALDAPNETVVTLRDPPVSASYARDSTSGAVAIAYATNEGAGLVPGFALIPEGLAESATPVRFTGVSRAPRVAVAPLSGGRFAVAMYATSGNKRVVAGVIDTASSGSGADGPSADAPGLACAKGEACATDPDAPTPPTAGIGIGAATGTEGEHVLVAYAREPKASEAPGCRSTATAPVLVNLLIAGRAGGIEERTTAALKLGTTLNWDMNPIVIGLEALHYAETARWLVGYTDQWGGMIFDVVAQEGDEIRRAQELPPIAELFPARFDQIAAALAVTHQGVQLGVARRDACFPEDRSRVSVAIFNLDVGAGSVVTAWMSHELGFTFGRVGETDSESNPSIAWNEERQAWLVAWRDAGGFRARVLDEELRPLGDAPYTLVEQSGGVKVLPATGAVPLAGAWFGALAAVSHPGDGSEPSFGFDVARLGACAQ